MATLLRPIFPKFIRPKEAFQKLYNIINRNNLNKIIINVDHLGITENELKCRDFCWVLGKTAELRQNKLIFDNCSPVSYDIYQKLMKELVYLNENNLIVYKSYLSCMTHSNTILHRDLVVANNSDLHYGAYIKHANPNAYKFTNHDIIKDSLFREQNINKMLDYFLESDMNKTKDIIIHKNINISTSRIERDPDDTTYLTIKDYAEILNLPL